MSHAAPATCWCEQPFPLLLSCGQELLFLVAPAALQVTAVSFFIRIHSSIPALATALLPIAKQVAYNKAGIAMAVGLICLINCFMLPVLKVDLLRKYKRYHCS